jgi:hypothetical protein
MGFSISQIINKFIPTKQIGSDIPDGWENPFGTGNGQFAFTEAETYEARMARRYKVKNQALNNVALTQGSSTQIIALTCRQGYVTIPLMISLGMSDAGYISFAFQNMPGDGVWMDFGTRIQNGGGNQMYFPKGAFRIPGGSSLQIAATATNASTKGLGSIVYVEVPE